MKYLFQGVALLPKNARVLMVLIIVRISTTH